MRRVNTGDGRRQDDKATARSRALADHSASSSALFHFPRIAPRGAGPARLFRGPPPAFQTAAHFTGSPRSFQPPLTGCLSHTDRSAEPVSISPRCASPLPSRAGASPSAAVYRTQHRLAHPPIEVKNAPQPVRSGAVLHRPIKGNYETRDPSPLEEEHNRHGSRASLSSKLLLPLERRPPRHGAPRRGRYFDPGFPSLRLL
ncbi:hypothetical protein AAFF_G00421620 [Aldrovandia affinis]|uniref:Uncharacterized protein n=1 Tax=Aldrovandia affinis TaxID=143900 RepID=A0AAD7S9X5_9TELE|nr:hypothetical protein AAFF_G00421620 [Aldrovandia affinis]